MSVFQLFWNLILGISGGIISGIIVSRIFLIQGDFQNQINSFDLLLRKLGYTSGMLLGIRTVQEFSYCQTAHCGRQKLHFDFGINTSPTVPYRHSPQALCGLTADCRSLV